MEGLALWFLLVKLPPAVPASQMGTTWSDGCSTSSPILYLCARESSGKFLSPSTHIEDPDEAYDIDLV